jgi:hypothetical protein
MRCPHTGGNGLDSQRPIWHGSSMGPKPSPILRSVVQKVRDASSDQNSKSAVQTFTFTFYLLWNTFLQGQSWRFTVLSPSACASLPLR